MQHYHHILNSNMFSFSQFCGSDWWKASLIGAPAEGSLQMLSVCFLSGLSRFSVQRSGSRRCGGSRGGGSSSAAGAGGRVLLLPPSVRSPHVHHPQTLQQENHNQRQEQRAGGGQSRLPVSPSPCVCMSAARSCVSCDAWALLYLCLKEYLCHVWSIAVLSENYIGLSISERLLLPERSVRPA